jgi:hypothetical protein
MGTINAPSPVFDITVNISDRFARCVHNSCTDGWHGPSLILCPTYSGLLCEPGSSALAAAFSEFRWDGKIWNAIEKGSGEVGDDGGETLKLKDI